MKVRECGQPVYGAGACVKVSSDYHRGSRDADSQQRAFPQKEEKLEEGPIRRLKSAPGPSPCWKCNRKGQEEIRFGTSRHFSPSARKHPSQGAAISAPNATQGSGFRTW